MRPSAIFNEFLYVVVGDDKNGTELTLLSALARQDVDPWSKAAEWSKLPRAAALQTIDSWLESMPGHESRLERGAITERLLSMLPRMPDVNSCDGDTSIGVARRGRSVHAPDLILVAVYFMTMVVAGWLFSDDPSPEVAAQSVAATAPVDGAQPTGVIPR